MKQYLIIGNGAAANAAAETLRRGDPEGKILMFSGEKHYFYYVPALPDYLCGEKQIKDFTIHNRTWYEKNRIDLHLETEIVEIQGAEKMAVTNKGERFPYDALLLACGGYSFIRPIPGAETPGVFALRMLTDADRIKEWARQSKKAVVIGGGLLGLEAGNGLRKMGLKVAVVEFSARLYSRQMDVPGAAVLQRQMEGMGFRSIWGPKHRRLNRRGKVWGFISREEKN